MIKKIKIKKIQKKCENVPKNAWQIAAAAAVIIYMTQFLLNFKKLMCITNQFAIAWQKLFLCVIISKIVAKK